MSSYLLEKPDKSGYIKVKQQYKMLYPLVFLLIVSALYLSRIAFLIGKCFYKNEKFSLSKMDSRFVLAALSYVLTIIFVGLP